MKRTWPLATIAVGSLLLAACSGQTEQADPDSAPAGDTVINVPYVGDITGGAAFCGQAGQEGIELAVEQFNSEQPIAGVTINLTVSDTASNPRDGAVAMGQVAASDADAALFGCASAVAVAVAPLAQEAGLPLVAFNSGVPGVVEAGEYVFRATAPQDTFHNLQTEYLAEQGIETAVVIYQSDSPTLVDLATKLYPDLLEESGIELLGSESFQGADVDFTALASKVVNQDPDAVILFGVGTPNVGVATQLIQSGYEGRVAGSPGFGNGILEPLGTDANGFTWPTWFNPAATNESTVEFVAAFEEDFGKEPSEFAAQGYDAALLLIEGIKLADGDYSREGIRAGIQAASEAGIAGAVGEIVFEDRDARIAGHLVEWQDGEVLAVE